MRLFVNFFHTGYMPSGLNSNFLIHIPNVSEANYLDKFCHMLNFLFKIVTKIIDDRLALVASRILSPQQFGFTKRHNISDCIIAASECVNLLDKKGIVAIKIDIKKAFDSLR